MPRLVHLKDIHPNAFCNGLRGLSKCLPKSRLPNSSKAEEVHKRELISVCTSYNVINLFLIDEAKWVDLSRSLDDV